ncbi:PQQ-binding-like beta-propeller repeat protein [Epidermidibacterium keratini]|uniref:PQQ-binding-like beta-propeller repeat protein n=1 Tax=Epidermidibacterium keratini TaxID=1891644 RepID=A0A7L4YRT2_9ACTN|nr:PQQ-binding-like beta-propeller repeat protein [Epidermidibacterium keratini]QHC01267.1 PQQ-binding-like beta-propeller repeat protein [Epidermidibacterium keratini]
MRRHWRGALLAVAALLVASCTVTTDGAPSPKRPVPDPTTAELSISDAPVFVSNDLAVHPVETAQLAGDDIAIITSIDTGLITAVNLATGQVAWQLEREAALPGDPAAIVWSGPVVATAAGSVIVPYFKTQCQTDLCAPGEVDLSDETGYAALSATDGTLLWKFATVPATSDDSEEHDYVSGLVDAEIAADQNVFVATVRQLTSSSGGQGPDVFSIGIDLESGTELWRVGDFAVYQIAGAVAYGVLFDTVDEYNLSGGIPTALDPATGTSIWQLTEAESGLVYAAAGPDGALMAPAGVSGEPLTLISAGGTDLGSPGTNAMWRCPQVPDSGRLACTLGYPDPYAPSRILSINEDATVLTSEAPVPRAATVSYVDDTYIYLTTTSDSGDFNSYAVDVHGNRLSRNFPGKVVATNAKYVVVLRNDSQIGGSVSVAAYSRT